MGLYRRGKIYWFSIQYQGKRIQRSLKTDNKKLAERIYAKVLCEIVEGRYYETVKARQYTFDEMMGRFMKEYAVQREVSTQKRYLSSFRNLNKHFKGMRLSDITPKVIASYMELRKSEGVAPATINRDLALLSKAFNLAIKQWEWCKINPCSQVQRERENNKIDRWLTEEEEKKLLEGAKGYLNGQLVDIIILALNTGMRQSEILNLRWQDVDLFRKIITVRKTKNKVPKVIPLNQSAYKLLLRRNKVVNMPGYVFATRNGTRISKRNLHREFVNALKKAEITNFRFHDLRHTFATRLVQSGIDLYSVARLLGHRDITTTQRYAHHSPESLRSSVEVLDKCYNSVTIKGAKIDGIAENRLKSSSPLSSAG